MAWFGWRWTPDGWRRVCQADSIGAAHRRLNKLLPAVTPSTHAALTGGAVPTWTPPTKEIAK